MYVYIHVCIHVYISIYVCTVEHFKWSSVIHNIDLGYAAWPGLVWPGLVCGQVWLAWQRRQTSQPCWQSLPGNHACSPQQAVCAVKSQQVGHRQASRAKVPIICN